MPYCVRCGVELQQERETCPLCGTQVLLPEDMRESEPQRRYPERVQRAGRTAPNLVPGKALMLIVSFALAIPFLVTFFVDWTGNGRVTWSFYPMMSLLLLWVLFSYPAILKKHTLLLVFSVDILAVAAFLVALDLYSGIVLSWSLYPALALLLIWWLVFLPGWLGWGRPVLVGLGYYLSMAGYLYIMDFLTGAPDWFIPLALPVWTLLACVTALLMTAVRLFGMRRLATAGAVVLSVGALLAGTDLLVNLFLKNQPMLSWSMIAAGVCLPVGIFLFVAEANADLRMFLLKKFHL